MSKTPIVKDWSSDSKFTFDFERMMKLQENIWKKYEDPTQINLACGITPKEFINKVDRYILHTIEELGEARTEYIENKLWDVKEESIDILLYLCTTASIVRMNYVDMKSLLETNPWYSNDVYLPQIEIGKNFLRDYDDFDSIMMDILGKLADGRRLFPERKWHKPSPAVDQEGLVDRLEKLFAQLRSAVTDILCLQLSIMTAEELEDKIQGKHNYIVGLETID